MNDINIIHTIYSPSDNKMVAADGVNFIENNDFVMSKYKIFKSEEDAEKHLLHISFIGVLVIRRFYIVTPL